MNVTRIASFATCALLLTAAPLWAQSSSTTVVLQNFRFVPAQLHLRAGQPVTLHLTNDSASGHSFAAPAFFAAAVISPASRAAVVNGAVEVPKHSNADITLTPATGRYPLKCSHTFHKTMGMSGTIVVD